MLKSFENLKYNFGLLKKYVFKEQREISLTEEVSQSDQIGETCYLLHCTVICKDKSVTKVHVIFDASAQVKQTQFE